MGLIEATPRLAALALLGALLVGCGDSQEDACDKVDAMSAPGNPDYENMPIEDFDREFRDALADCEG